MIDYQYAGAIHILSVSGLHVCYLLLFSKLICKTNSINIRRASYTLLTPFLFAIIAGYLPVLRSVVMFSFVAVGYQLRRTVNIYHIDSFSTINFTFSTLPADVGFNLVILHYFFIVWFQPIIPLSS
jgi:competence protein ComEC